MHAISLISFGCAVLFVWDRVRIFYECFFMTLMPREISNLCWSFNPIAGVKNKLTDALQNTTGTGWMFSVDSLLTGNRMIR